MSGSYFHTNGLSRTNKILLAAIVAWLVFVVVVEASVFSGSTPMFWQPNKSGETIMGSGIQMRQVRELDVYQSINIAGNMDFELGIGNESKCTLVGDNNIISEITSQVEKGALTVKVESSYFEKLPLKVSCVSPAVTRVILMGASTARLNNLTGDTFEVTQQGAGTVTLQGDIDMLKAIIQGAGTIDASALALNNAEVAIQGAGDILVPQAKRVGGSIMGSGEIKVGEATESKDVLIMGPGSVSRY